MIYNVQDDGVYEFKNLIVHEFHGLKSVNTGRDTIITASTKAISKTSSKIPELETKSFTFPPLAVRLESFYECSNPKCRSKCIAVQGAIQKCSECRSLKLTKEIKYTYNAILTFHEDVEVVMTNQHINTYLRRRNSTQDKVGEEEICREMLMDTKTTIVTNYKNVCFGVLI